jgi:hypothetical protein
LSRDKEDKEDKGGKEDKGDSTETKKIFAKMGCSRRQKAEGRRQRAEGSSRSVLRRSRQKKKILKLKRGLSKRIWYQS